MEKIEASMTKVKAIKKIIYSFLPENGGFEAHFSYGKNQSLTLLHKGTQIGAVNNPGNKVPINVDTENGPLNITAWINGGFSKWIFGNGAGIEVNGKPVQYTLTDPSTQIKTGRIGLFILLFLYALTSVVQLVSGEILTAAIYSIFFIILLIAALVYKKWLTFALIVGAIFSILDMADYFSSVPGKIQSGISPVQIILWIAFRVVAFVYLVNAFIWKHKDKAK